MAIVTLAEFKHQLGRPSDDITADVFLNMKLDQATGLVLDYIRRSDDADQVAMIEGWTSEPGSPLQTPVPVNVQAAILQWATELTRFRGDDVEDVKRENPGDPSPTVKALLARNGRRPVFA
jgi:hypothetical protein